MSSGHNVSGSGDADLSHDGGGKDLDLVTEGVEFLGGVGVHFSSEMFGSLVLNMVILRVSILIHLGYVE